jgi:hypothetical protein
VQEQLAAAIELEQHVHWPSGKCHNWNCTACQWRCTVWQ